MGFQRGIPTKFAGVQFRSRLEARWASFFTKLGWDWSYEPYDLNGYVPDFLLHMRTDVLVEVKPFTRFDDGVIAAAHEKIAGSGWAGGAIVVGARLHDAEDGFIAGDFSFGPAENGYEGFVTWCCDCNRPTLTTDSDQSCWLCGDAHCYWNGDIGRRKRVFGAWVEAGNEVQWRRPA